MKLKEILISYKKAINFAEELSDLGLDIFETPVMESLDHIVDNYIGEFLNEEGVDLIYWWLFEDVDKIIVENDTEICVEDIDEFCKYIEQHYL